MSEEQIKSGDIELEFHELEQYKQIEKLRYELQIALKSISNMGNRIITLQEHQHSDDGKVLIPFERHNRVFQADRSMRLR